MAQKRQVCGVKCVCAPCVSCCRRTGGPDGTDSCNAVGSDSDTGRETSHTRPLVFSSVLPVPSADTWATLSLPGEAAALVCASPRWRSPSGSGVCEVGPCVAAEMELGSGCLW